MASLYLEELVIHSFRNWAGARVAFSPGQNALIGPNGAGKTSLLEAIYVLALGRSFRSSHDESLARWGSSGWRVEGSLRDERGLRRVEVRWDGTRGKRIRVAGKPLPKLSALMGKMPVILFTPDELHLLKGSPQLRRAWLDRLLMQSSPSYLEKRSRMKAALLQRNAALRHLGKRGDRGSEEAWGALWIEAAAPVAAERQAFFLRYLPMFREAAAAMLGTAEVDLYWQPGGGKEAEPPTSFPSHVEGWRNLLREQLEERHREEERRLTTLVGPHRDEIHIFFRGRRARFFASQGEQRSLVLALKAAEIRYLQEQLGVHPVALLDDIFSELDVSHRSRLQVMLGEEGQSFFTTTDPQWVPQDRSIRRIWVADGAVGREDG
ncbi:MAG: DNA replication and repair protein RecF [Bacillota bacterium]|nr:DNA replication and repair protein RecF [Bacillota bacterium]